MCSYLLKILNPLSYILNFMNIPNVRLLIQDIIMVLLYFSSLYIYYYFFFVLFFFTSFEVGQIFLGKRPSFGLIPDLPPIHPNSPRSGLLSNSNSGQPRRPDRTSTQNSVPSSPILGTRGGYSPVRDQRMFIASFCRLDVN